MHTPEYTAKIRALIEAKDGLEDGLRYALWNFRNGYKVPAEQLEQIKTHLAKVLEIIDPEAEKEARHAEAEAKLREIAEEIRADLETGLQREEAELYISTQSQSGLLVVPGEEGLYQGKVITIHTTGEILTAETSSWAYGTHE